MFNDLYEFVSNNQFASAGLLTVAGSSILIYCKSIPNKIKTLLWSNFTTTLYFYSNTNGFSWVEEWFDENYKPRYGRLRVKGWNSKVGEYENIKYVLTYGNYWCWYNKKPIYLTRYKEKGENTNTDYDVISVTFFEKKKVANKFVQEIHDMFQSKDDKTLNVYINSNGWQHITQRPLTLVPPILEDGKFEEILEDMETFVNNEKDYIAKGIPYKRGYIFYGPPGNGKTTAITALAAKLKKNIYHMSMQGMSSTKFTELVSSARSGLLVIEDIDCINSTHKREDKEPGDDSVKSYMLDMSTILNVLDGNLTPHGLMFIITTNHKEKLDPALLRPGRTDVHIDIEGPDKNKIRKLYQRLCGNIDESFVEQEYSCMADVQVKILEKLKGK